MILVDTSVWIDHFRATDTALQALLEKGGVLMHPFVVGELACGNLPRRSSVLESLDSLPASLIAHDREVRVFVEKHRLYGLGVGLVDCHLLASTVLSSGALLWTRDRRLAAVAERMGIGHAAHPLY